MDDRRDEFERLFADHHGTVLRYIQRRVDQPEQAQELAMDCFEVAWKRFDPDHPFGVPWLLRTAHHLVGDSYRRRDRERAGLSHVADELRLVEHHDSHERIALGIALDGLREPDREVLLLVYWDGLSASEVAETIGCRVPAVWKRLSRARAALRVLLESAPTPVREVNSDVVER